MSIPPFSISQPLSLSLPLSVRLSFFSLFETMALGLANDKTSAILMVNTALHLVWVLGLGFGLADDTVSHLVLSFLDTITS